MTTEFKGDSLQSHIDWRHGSEGVTPEATEKPKPSAKKSPAKKKSTPME